MKPIIYISAAVAAVGLVGGCGGGGGADRSGRASIAIEWPEPGRLIPKAAGFVRVRAFTSGGSPVGTAPPPVAKPTPPASNTSVITIDNLPVGTTVTFRAEAFANLPADGDGQVAQASGQQALLIRNDAPNTFDISMASTVTNVTFLRDGTPTANVNLTAGEDTSITAQARTATGALVLVHDSNWSWTSGVPQLTVNSGAAATGPTVVSRGLATVNNATLSVMETESNIPGNLTVSVIQPTYPGAVDGAIAGDATGFGDVAAGPMETKAAGDRAFVLITRDPCGPTATCSRREVDIHDAGNIGGMPIMGNFVPSFPGPAASSIVRNTTGIVLAYDNQTGEAALRNFNDDGSIEWTSSGLGFLSIIDISARKGFTYVLQDGPGVGYRISKLRDSDGAIVKDFIAPRGVDPSRMTVDDQENFYFGTGDSPPFIVKMDRNGDAQPFDISPVSFSNVNDLDFDQGLIYGLDNGDGANVAYVRVFGQAGQLVQTIPVSRQRGDGEIALRMAVFRGQVFVVTSESQSGFVIRQIQRPGPP